MCRVKPSSSLAISSRRILPAPAATAIAPIGGKTLAANRAFDLAAIAAVTGSDAGNAALTRAKDFVISTDQAAARVAARDGARKQAWNAVRAACDPNFRATPQNSHRRHRPGWPHVGHRPCALRRGRSRPG